MRSRISVLAAAGLIALGGLTACTSGGGDSTTSSGTKISGPGKVGVILPDTETSQRWGTDDPKLLKAAFAAADVPVDIQNADGDKEKFKRIADEMISGGAKVLMIVNLDSASGKAVLDEARAAGVKTVDYDRLTLNGGADYYVSFDNKAVGELQGKGLVQCLTAKGVKVPKIAELNGSPDDNNATLFKAGYDSILQPLYDDAVYLKGPDQAVDDWDNDEATVVFREMWNQTGKGINGVLAANDGLANSVIQILRQSGKNGEVPVTGQDATVPGLQNVLAGDQCMTVYKPIKKEADAAADLAIKLYKGEQATAAGRVKDTESGAYVPSVLLQPQAIFKKDVGSVIKDGFVEKKAVCAGRFAAFCAPNGIN
ncbi:substrate-binding domain-containing protein [Winogradskya consettensis]|uniref:Sugar ABC transporter substrate-binding protein n=1 Tax=Winogradskya consettensis TaxID=113560 RepID=A0A919SC15_9ACTN|nr:substrate-binding domain-containing protein [Actinoplanes consettensis]GIM68947.1 sugar ABC transporter substrate-binding protein [Actinoplanes consettensis]